MKLAVLMISFLLVTAGCISQQEPEKQTFVIRKHGIEYLFSNPIENSSLVPVENEDEILQKILTAETVKITFESHEEDNIVFQLAGVEMASKLSHFYVYGQGRFVDVKAAEISGISPKENETVILMKGPNTGADGTSIHLSLDEIIVVEGDTEKNLMLATDRLALIYLKE
ncbi:MAG: hypothetical protein HYW25_02840 [Candidatus Aenigmarchaeota archaeon]|nr:hypothetical protein [Candidatus Aenigmarchaeota archaeon]